MKTKNYKDFINSKQTAYPSWNRLKIFGEEYHFYKERNKKSLKILDIGCGKEVYLRKFYLPGDKYYACDFYDKPNIKVKKYKIIKIRSVSVWNFWPDRIVTRFFKSLASDNIFILKK